MCSDINRKISYLLEPVITDKFVVVGQDKRCRVFIDGENSKDLKDDLEQAVKEVVTNRNLKDENVKIEMNKRTCGLLSTIFITLPYVMKLFYHPVSISETLSDGEIKVLG